MDKKTIDNFFNEIDKHFKAPELSYTDWISLIIKDALKKEKDLDVGSIDWDLTNDGTYKSSKKTLKLKYRDTNYTITITNDNEK